MIRISDNGIGMTDEVRQRIFESLFTTKAVGKGTELGLTIAHQIIVEKHGGAIKVNSTLNQKTEFMIILPLKQQHS
jgi:signal transduction histidine kinase